MSDEHRLHWLNSVNPLVLIQVFLALILNVFGNVTQDWCKVVLGFAKISLDTYFGSLGRSQTSEERDAVCSMPIDVRTVRKYFNMDPRTQTFAACPKCSSTYAPTLTEEGVPLYPVKCTYKRFETSKPCNEQLTKYCTKNKKRKAGEAEAIQVPIRPYVVQSFDSFLANLVSQPGMAKLFDIWTGFQLSDSSETRTTRHAHDTRECAPVS